METRRCYGCMEEISGEICPKCGYPADKDNAAHQLPVGTVLDQHYLVGRVLGQGGFGITYLGYDLHLGDTVAVKEFYPSTVVNRDNRVSTHVRVNTEEKVPDYEHSMERFLREARALSRFRDVPEIVGIYSCFRENGTAYIVMEYVRGRELKDYVNIRGGRLSVQEGLRLLEPIVRALATVHREGLVHRDISPDNIMLHPMGGAKLLDFGAVRHVENPDADRDMAHSTEAIVKQGFAPIEQYRNRGGLGPWTDEYALCATLYYCLTGRVPPDALARSVDGEEPDWEGIPGLTEGQRRALTKGMALRAKDRYPDMEAFYTALYTPEPVPEMAPPREQPEKVSVTAPKKKRQSLKWLIPAAAALLALAAGIFIFMPRKAASPQLREPEVNSQTAQTAPPVTEAPQPEMADSLSLWVSPVGNWGNEAMLQPLLEAFAQQTGIQVEVEYLTYVDRDAKTITALQGGALPDLILAEPEFFAGFHGLGAPMVDVTDLFDSQDAQQIHPAVLAACTEADGRRYQYPLAMTVYSMAINKTVFQAAGAMEYLDPETHTWNSTEDFFRAVNAVSSYTDQLAGIIYCGGTGGDQGTRALVTNLYGGSFTNPEHTAYTWDTPEMITALEALSEHQGLEFSADMMGGDEIALFYYGDLSMAFCWNQHQQLNPNSAGGAPGTTMNGDEILFMAFPSDGTPQLSGNIWSFGIFDNGDPLRINSAKAFLSYMCDSPATAEAVRLSGYFPVRTSAGGADLSRIWADDPVLDAYGCLTEFMGDYYSLTPGWANARTAWRNMLQSISQGEIPASAAKAGTENANSGMD